MSQELGPYGEPDVRGETRHGGHTRDIQHDVSHRQVPSWWLAPSMGWE